MLESQFVKKICWQYSNDKIYYHQRGIFTKTWWNKLVWKQPLIYNNKTKKNLRKIEEEFIVLKAAITKQN